MTQTLVPADLRLHHPRTPWQISSALEGRLERPSSEYGFWRVAVLSADPEFDFVRQYFFASQPVGYGISKITCLSRSSNDFESTLRAIETASGKNPSLQNHVALQSWKASTDLFSPIDISNPYTDPSSKETLTSAKVLPLWGFGKHHPNGTARICYLTTSTRYAVLHHQDFLMLSWVSMPQPHPIMSCSDIEIHQGELRRTYYIPLVFRNPGDPPYAPCPANQSPEMGEFVVNYSQTLPRFQIELAIDAPDLLFTTWTLDALHTAAYTGRVDVLKRWIAEDDKRLYQKDSKGHTLWHTAIRGTQLPVLEWLHEKDPNFLTQPGDDDSSLINFAKSCGALPLVNYWIFRQKNPDIQNFPNFMALGLDPQNGPYVEVQFSRPPLSYWEVYEEALKNMANEARTGAVIGGALGAVVGLFANLKKLQKEEEQSDALRNIGTLASIGAFVLGVAGALRSVAVTRRLLLDREKVQTKIPESAERAKAIIEAFVKSHMTFIKDIELITCPLSKTVMVFPTDVMCGSEPPHIFEYFFIAKWLSDPANHNACPTCKKPNMQIANLEFDHKRGFLVIKGIKGIFATLETLLNRLPKSYLGWGQMPHFSDSQQIAELAKKIDAGQPLLAMETDQIVQKIKSNTLSDTETYALGHYLIYRLQPLQDKVDDIYLKSDHYLQQLWMKHQIIDETVHDTQRKELGKWYDKLRLVPPECTTLSQLYRIKEKV